MFKYILWKLFKLGVALSVTNREFSDIFSDFIMHSHNAITTPNYFADTDLSHQNMREIQFCNAQMEKINLSYVDIAVEKCIVRHIFDYPTHQWNFCVVYMNKINFTHARLKNVVFSKVVFESVNFCDADLSNSYFIECKLDNVAFSRATLSYATFEDCNFLQAEFVNATISYGKFIYCDFNNVFFSNTDMRGCRLHNIECWRMSSLNNCNLDDTVLDSVSQRNIFIKNI